MTAEGARGCAWRAAGRRCRGCRHADVSRHRTQPYRTVPYHTVSYLTAGTYGKAYLTLSLSKKARGKESRCGKPAEMWKTLWKACGKLASRRLGRCGRGGQPDGYFRPDVVRRGRSGGQERRARAWMRWRRRRFWRQPGAAGMGACRQGGCAGARFWSGTVWRALSAGAGVVDAFGWRVVAAVRCGTRVQRRARWLAFFLREKTLDKLCKSIRLEVRQGLGGTGGRRDTSTASGEQSSASSPRGKRLMGRHWSSNAETKLPWCVTSGNTASGA